MRSAIRPMHQSDIDSVYAIEQLAHRAPWSREVLSDCVSVGYDCRVLELTVDNTKQIVGYIICRQSVNVCHILNLCVDLSHQGRGYGKLLLQTMLDSLSSDAAINTIILEVRPTNVAAISLYEQFGFHQDSVKKGYYNNGHSLEDAILLKKLLLH